MRATREAETSLSHVRRRLLANTNADNTAAVITYQRVISSVAPAEARAVDGARTERKDSTTQLKQLVP